MPKQDSLNLIQTYIDAVNADEPGQVENLLTDDLKWSSPAGKRTGRKETRAYMDRWFSAFPDLKLERCNIIANENQAAVECRLTGTHQNNFVSDFGQFEPTNKRIDVDCVNLFKFKNGKIAEIHVLYDTMVILNQLGIQAQRRAA